MQNLCTTEVNNTWSPIKKNNNYRLDRKLWNKNDRKTSGYYVVASIRIQAYYLTGNRKDNSEKQVLKFSSIV